MYLSTEYPMLVCSDEFSLFSFTVSPRELSKAVENPPSHILLPTLIPSVGRCQVSQHFVIVFISGLQLQYIWSEKRFVVQVGKDSEVH